jgi:hypothetical protein
MELLPIKIASNLEWLCCFACGNSIGGAWQTKKANAISGLT